MAEEFDKEALAELLFEAARREAPAPRVKQQAMWDAAHANRRRSRAANHRGHWWLFAAAMVGAAALSIAGLVASPLDAPQTAISAEPVHAPEFSAAPSVALRPAPGLGQEMPRAPRETSAVEGPAALSAHTTAQLPPASLEQELAMLDQARQALLGGDPKGALASLARYDRVASQRHLGAEATVLRIETLAVMGRSAEASELGRQFVARNPNSPLVDRAKSFISSPGQGAIERVGP